MISREGDNSCAGTGWRAVRHVTAHVVPGVMLAFLASSGPVQAGMTETAVVVPSAVSRAASVPASARIHEAEVRAARRRPPSPSTVERSMWVWHPESSPSLISVARRNGVTRLLLWVSPGFSNKPAVLRNLRSIAIEASSAGIAVDALCGDPSWAKVPVSAQKWALEVRSVHLFDRLHLDIEPHALADWDQHRDVLTSGLVAALRGASAAGLPVDADIPYWYWRIPTADGQRLDSAVMRVVDGITIMAYQSTASRIVAVAATEVEHAAALSRAVHIGVDLTPPGADGPLSTLHRLNARQLRATLRAVDGGLRPASTYQGLALHDYAALAALA